MTFRFSLVCVYLATFGVQLLCKKRKLANKIKLIKKCSTCISIMLYRSVHDMCVCGHICSNKFESHETFSGLASSLTIAK